ncbi:MAG: oxidoreductase [Deltaproteobacteria bacterium]|nr:oxidoreductase [Deltaproteobacteria bacterium]
MSPLDLVLVAVGVVAGSGLASIALVRAPRLATFIAALGAALGGIAGLLSAIVVLRSGFTGELAGAWQVPGGGLVIGIDPLSAFFLAPLFVLGALAAVYGRSYLPRAMAAALLNLLIATMVLVVIARHALLFLVAWEAMTLTAYLLITSDHGDALVRRAGWVYLIASHVGVIALLALFVTLGARAGGALDFAALASAWQAPSGGSPGILLLALLGFGVKAGLVGLHAWLPEAHAAAPSHVSALMSGVLIKMGIYGLLRLTCLVPPGAWFGLALAVLGLLGALLGIVLALYQRDLKRVLAYSSVENVGVILTGLGLGFWARARGNSGLAAIALGGALLHLWNHAAMKGLMFLCAGSVLHGAGTKDVEKLGGLLGRMPWTGRAMIVGAVAIAALPPFCGFTGEWLLYQAMAQIGTRDAATASLGAMAGAAALALVGGFTALCFVRLVGVVLLGAPRSEQAARAHESPLAMTLPMAVLAAACVASALAAPTLVSAQSSLHGQLGTATAEDVAAAADLLAPLVVISAAIMGAIALVGLLLGWRVRRASLSETWGCGYAAPTPRMQYTGRAFSELLATRALPRWVRATLRVHPPCGLFPGAAKLATDTTDPLTRSAFEPFLVRCGNRFARLRFLQQGNIHVYLLYILATAIGGLGWVAVKTWWMP